MAILPVLSGLEWHCEPGLDSGLVTSYRKGSALSLRLPDGLTQRAGGVSSMSESRPDSFRGSRTSFRVAAAGAATSVTFR